MHYWTLGRAVCCVNAPSQIYLRWQSRYYGINTALKEVSCCSLTCPFLYFTHFTNNFVFCVLLFNQGQCELRIIRLCMRFTHFGAICCCIELNTEIEMKLIHQVQCGFPGDKAIPKWRRSDTRWTKSNLKGTYNPPQDVSQIPQFLRTDGNWKILELKV